jgi:hypothetical protein
MYTEMALTARRFALTLAVAGIAGLGSIAVAPAASATPASGPGYTVVHTDGGNGPDAFIVLDHGVRPVFFCDSEKPMKQHNKCTVPVTNPTRF